MKKLLFILTVTFSIFSFSQETYKVYGTTNGIPNVTPSSKVVNQNGTTRVYGYTNGVQNINPTLELKPQGNRVNVYQYNNGVPSIAPTKVIVPTTPTFAYPTYER